MEQKNITDGSIAIELNLFIWIGYVFLHSKGWS